MIANLLGKKP